MTAPYCPAHQSRDRIEFSGAVPAERWRSESGRQSRPVTLGSASSSSEARNASRRAISSSVEGILGVIGGTTGRNDRSTDAPREGAWRESAISSESQPGTDRIRNRRQLSARHREQSRLIALPTPAREVPRSPRVCATQEPTRGTGRCRSGLNRHQRQRKRPLHVVSEVSRSGGAFLPTGPPHRRTTRRSSFHGMTLTAVLLQQLEDPPSVMAPLHSQNHCIAA